jgi:hypothetical protein
MCRNSRFKTTQVDSGSAIATLLTVLNLNESNFNGIIKNKIVKLIEHIIRK